VSTIQLDEDQGISVDVNKDDNLIWPGSTFDQDHDLEGICIPDHHPNGSEESVSAASNPGSFQPTLLELDDAELDTIIYVPALQVTIKNIQALKSARLKESGMGPDNVDQLRDPAPACCTLDMSNTHLVKASTTELHLFNRFFL
jgi:hypothetical protein